MIGNFRQFEAGPDPFGRTWKIEFKWLQTAVSIRHSDSVDVKFAVDWGDGWQEKVISLGHPDLLKLSEACQRPLTDAWCMKLAALHLEHMVQTAEDIDKTLIRVPYADMERWAGQLQQAAVAS